MDHVPVDRRSFLGFVSLVLGAIVGAGLTAAGAFFVVAPALRGRAASGETDWSPVEGSVEGPGTGPKRVTVRAAVDAGWAKTVQPGAVFIDRGSDGSPRCFSARCPHEGCQVEWRGERDEFVCPCHNSVFSREGDRVSGPTKRGLDPLAVRTAGSGQIEVQFAVYALDSADRVRVG